MSTTISDVNPLSISKFNAKALINRTNLMTLSRCLESTNLVDNLKAMFTDKAQFINSIKWYPINYSSWLNVENGPIPLTLGGITPTITEGGTTLNVGVDIISSIKKARLVASIEIPESYQSYLDYEPYTSGQIYLPFLGTYALPIKDCMGDLLDVYYAIDFDTGIATAYVLSGTRKGQQIERLILMASGKIGIDIPIGSTNASEIARKNFENGAKLVASSVAIAGGFATGNLVGGLVATKGVELAISSGVNAVVSQQKHYQRGSLTGGQDALIAPTNVVVTLYRPLVAISSDFYYNKLKGRPLGISAVINDMVGTGFTIIEEVHLKNFTTALKSEVEEIESLLHEGVIL